MSFAMEFRLVFIDAWIETHGEINRDVLSDHFGLSAPQTSIELRRFQDRFPDRIRYDASAKAFVPDSDQPAYPRHVHGPVLAATQFVREAIDAEATG